MTFRGDRIKELRKAARFSQDELAKRADIQRNAIHTYEAGKRHPPLDILTRLVTALGTNSAYLLGEIDYSGPLTERDSAMLRDLHSRGESPDTDDFLDVWLDHLPKQE